MHLPRFWETLSLSAGLLRSFKPAPTRHHFMNGAQKNTVFGPGECLVNQSRVGMVISRRTCGVVDEGSNFGHACRGSSSGHDGKREKSELSE